MEARRRVLIISYFWPPAGGVTVLRCLKIAKYLRSFGWEPVVYTASDARYPYLDSTGVRDVPEGMTVLKQPIIEPIGLFKTLTGRRQNDPLTNLVHVRDRKRSWVDTLALRLRGNIFIPDARALWIRPSVRFLTRWLKENSVDAIFSDGPPHTNTMIGCRLKQATGLPWIADFQDPWTQIDYYPQLGILPWADRRHKSMESEVFRTADRISIASPTWKRDLERIGARNVGVLYYGYDEDDFRRVKSAPSDRFVILHTGLLGIDRNPENVIQALSDLRKSHPDIASRMVFRQYGEMDFEVRDGFANHGISDMLEYRGVASRNIVLAEACSAGLLLLPINQSPNAKGRLPGKLYEYLRAGRPILGLGHSASDTGQILAETGRGDMVDYSDVEATTSILLRRFREWEVNPRPWEPDDRIHPYSNLHQTGLVAQWLNEIVRT